MSGIADWNNYELDAIDLISHGQARLFCRQLKLADYFSRGLVVRTKHWATSCLPPVKTRTFACK